MPLKKKKKENQHYRQRLYTHLAIFFYLFRCRVPLLKLHKLR